MAIAPLGQVSLLLVLFIAGTAAEERRLAGEEGPLQAILDQLLQKKQAVQAYLQGDGFHSYVQQLKHNATSQQHSHRGVLIVAGGRDMFANAAITLHVLRRVLGSKLPVEIVHFGEHELPKDVLQVIQSYNGTGADQGSQQGLVFVTDGLQAAPQAHAAPHHRQMEAIKGFPAKVYALAFVTRFQQVLLLDADSMPLVDPALLFEVATFRRFGSMFWPDLWHSAWVNASIYTVLAGMQNPPWHGDKHHRLVDSGQLLLDRAKLADVLQYLWLLNSHHEWVYKHMHGDKDTFFLAFAMAGKPEAFKMVPCFVRDAMRHVPGHKHTFHHLGMIQSLPTLSLGAAIAAVKLHSLPVALPDLLQPAAQQNSTTGSAVKPGEQEQLLAAANEDADGPAPPPPGQAAAAQLRPRVAQSRRVGLPVFFHRTSFNSKFFPDCLGKAKVESHYCEVEWVSLPLSNEQAGKSLKPHMFAFDGAQVDTGFFDKHCRGSGNSSSGNSSDSAGAAAGGGGAAATLTGRRLAADWLLLQQGNGSGRHARGSGHKAASEQPRQRPCRWWGLLCHAAAAVWQKHQQQPSAAAARQQGREGQLPQQGPQPEASFQARPQQWQRQLHSASGRSLAAGPRQQHLLLLQQLAERHLGLPPERGCGALRDAAGEDVLPIPVMPVELFGAAAAVLRQSYEAFGTVRAALIIKDE